MEFEDQLLAQCSAFEETILSLVGTVFRFLGSDETISGLIAQSGHLSAESATYQNVYIIEHSGADSVFPFVTSEASGSELGVNYFFIPGQHLALIHFSESGNRFVLFRQPSQPNTADVLRLIYQWLVGDSAVPIHGGTISWGEKTALVSNIGGSGKSSLIISAVLSGAKTTGDDFGLMQTGENFKQFTAWSQFQTFKLASGSPSRQLVVSPPLFQANGKGIYSFESEVRGSVEMKQPIDQIVIPILGATLSARPASLEESIKHIAISSSGMALERARTTLELVKMCKQTPSVILTLPRTSVANAAFLREMLS